MKHKKGRVGAAHHRGSRQQHRRQRYEIAVSRETFDALEILGRLLHKSPGAVVSRFVLGRLE
jgi:hypothetical protein